MPASRTQRTTTARRRTEALALREAGVKLDVIAARLGYSGKAAVSKDLARALEASLQEQHVAADQLRALELSRLDRLQQGAWPAAVTGDHRAAKIVLDVMDRRAKYLGLDKHTGNSEYVASILGKLATALGMADAQLHDQGAYDGLVTPDGVQPPADPDDDGYAPPDGDAD